MLLRTIDGIRDNEVNENLKIEGILMTMVDGRVNLSQEIYDTLEKNYGKEVRFFKSFIPKSVRVPESSVLGKSIYKYDPKGKVAEAYRELSKEVLADE